MGSKPITKRAGTKYGSAPANQEVTVDAGGTTPARFARMSPIKQVADEDKPVTSTRTGDVRDADGNLLKATEVTEQYPDTTVETGLNLDPLSEAKPGTGGENNPEYTKFLQGKLDQGYSLQDLADKKYGTVEGMTGLGLKEKPSDYMTSTVSGETTKSYDYKPVERDANTFKIREARRRDRNIKRAGRVMGRDLKKYGETSAEYASSKAAYDRYLRERTEGVNPYQKTSSKEKVKAGKGTQTQAEFEAGVSPSNPYGYDGKKGISIGTPKRNQVSVADTGLVNSTPDAFRLMRGTNPLEEKQPGIAKSRGYKMGGFGSKNK